MSDQDMINVITQAIQDPAKLNILMTAIITKSLPNVPTLQLQAIMQALGLPQS